MRQSSIGLGSVGANTDWNFPWKIFDEMCIVSGLLVHRAGDDGLVGSNQCVRSRERR